MDAPKSRPGPRSLRLARGASPPLAAQDPDGSMALRGLRVARSALRELRGELFTTETSDGWPIPARPTRRLPLRLPLFSASSGFQLFASRWVHPALFGIAGMEWIFRGGHEAALRALVVRCFWLQGVSLILNEGYWA